jgi:ABC-type branched-subunit amino acid transport system ATPase component
MLNRLGLSYLALSRSGDTLSGGEAQRVRLAAQLGSNLTGVCYVLDEPTVGLHPADVNRIAEILREKKRPLGVNDICDALLQEKKYKTKAKNFKANVRILLYKNEKGLFKKAGPGRFRAAAKK